MNLRLMLFALVTLGLILAALLLTDRPEPMAPPAPSEEPPTPAASVPPTEAPERGTALAQAGERALIAKDPKAAIRLLEEALKESPYNARWADLLRQAREQLAARARDPRQTPIGSDGPVPKIP